MFNANISKGYFSKGFSGWFRGLIPTISSPGKVKGSYQTASVVGSIETAKVAGDYKTANVQINLEILQGAL